MASIDLGPIQIENDDIVGRRVTIIGRTGSGKSNTLRIFIKGIRETMPVTVIDPEGEHHTLKNLYPDLVIAGRGTHVAFPLDTVEQAGTLATFAYEHGLTVVLDLSKYDSDEGRDAIVHAYLKGIWDAASDKPRQYFIFLEESYLFIPQSESFKPRPLHRLIRDIARRGRKRDLGLGILNQRLADIDKSIVTQSDYFIFLQFQSTTDLEAAAGYIPSSFGSKPKKIEALMSQARGQALYVYRFDARVIDVPLSEANPAPASESAARVDRVIDEKLLADLQALLSPTGSPEVPAPPADDQAAERAAALRVADAATIRELHRQVEDYKVLVENLRTQIKGLEQTNKVLSARVYAPDKAAKQQAAQPQPVVQAPPVATPVIDAAAATMQRAAAARQIRTEQIAAERQRTNLAELCQKIRAQEKKDRLLLASCLENIGKWVNPQAVAVRFSYASDRYSRNPPRTLLDMKLIDRGMEKDTKRTVYKLSDSLRGRYPNLDGKDVAAKVFAACGVI